MLKTIQIKFLDDNDEVILKGSALSVLDAEGELERLARAYQNELTKTGVCEVEDCTESADVATEDDHGYCYAHAEELEAKLD